jgi:Arc/MetJ-type ribon-helix-helix transcriptional regulator
MDVVLKRSSVRKYVEEQVKQGHFASPSEVIEAALMRLMLDDASEPFDAETLAAIKRGASKSNAAKDEIFPEPPPSSEQSTKIF